MRALLAVMWFELRRYRLLPAGALLLGLMALAMPWLPGYGRLGAHDVRGSAALLAAALVYLVAALLTGSSIMAGGREGEAGFHLARPVGWFQLWLGRLAAVVALAAVSPLLALTPVLAVDRYVTLPEHLLAQSAWLLGLTLILAPLAGVVRLGLRVRSPWLVVLAAGGGLAWVVQGKLVWGPLFRLFFGLNEQTGTAFALLLAAAAAILWLVPALAGSAAAARRAGDDRRAAAWGLGVSVAAMAAGLALAAALLSWIFAAPPQAVVRVHAVWCPPEGEAALVWARVRRAGVSFPAQFLVDTASGGWRRLGQRAVPSVRGVHFDCAGRRLAVVEATLSRVRGWVMDESAVVYDLGPGPRILRRHVVVPEAGSVRWMVLSPEGSKLLTSSGKSVTVWDVDSRKPLARAHWPGGWPAVAVLDDEGSAVLGFWEGFGEFSRTAAARFVELRPGRKGLRPLWSVREVRVFYTGLGTVPTEAGPAVALAVRAEGGYTVGVRRLRDGAPLWTSRLEGSGSIGQVLPLGWDAVAVVERWEDERRSALALVRPQGTAWEWKPESQGAVFVVPGPEPRILTAVVVDHQGSEWPSFLLDIRDGSAAPLGKGVVPASDPWYANQLPEAGSPGARLFVRHRHELLLWRENGRLEPLRFR